MKYWQLIAKNTLKLSEQSGRSPKDKEIRIKVEKVLLTPTDVLVYDERISHPYPMIPGRFAIGTVCEGYGVNEQSASSSNRSQFQRNEKVLLRTYYHNSDDIPYIVGSTKHGYLKNFAYVTPEEIFHIPHSVSENDALYMELVAMAEAAIEATKADDGDFVLVSGEDIMSLILCQLLLYYKIVPILVTSSPEKVAIAKKVGIFYTFEANDSLQKNVFQVTGGNFCDCAIYCNSMNRTTPSMIMSLLRYGATLIFAGSCDRSWSVDSATITAKALTVCGIQSGFGFEHMALGILATHVVDLSLIEVATTTFANVEEAYNRLNSPNAYHTEIIIID